ncbi:MAG: putative metalloprotease CJM1_0395 family protein [Oceanisphaera sp.]|uniref:putative metalloprotease CJM1_0395 family protein n=1 Tax=Oceanisphaera sp. TaxID=1929979 RepID=UPI003F964F83
MQIPHSNQELFPLAQPMAASQIQQDNAQRPLISPITETDTASSRQSATDNFTSSEQKAAPELYKSQGQPEGAAKKIAQNSEQAEVQATEENTDETSDDKEQAAIGAQKNAAGKELSIEQQEELLQLQQRDQEVRVHEQQHASVGGQHTGSARYEYETGPDGKQYVVEGSVSVDLSPIAGDPNATIEKMQQVKAAALAPAEPSSADKNAAARADQLIVEARAELQQANEPESEGRALDEKSTTTATTPANAETSSTASTSAIKSPTDIATDTPTAKDANGQMEQRNQVIAGVYGQAAKVQSQQLLNLA